MNNRNLIENINRRATLKLASVLGLGITMMPGGVGPFPAGQKSNLIMEENRKEALTTGLTRVRPDQKNGFPSPLVHL